MLARHEGHHAVEIGTGKCVGLLYGVEQSGYLGTLEVGPQPTGSTCRVQMLGGETVQHIRTSLAQAELEPDDLVAQLEGTE